MQDTSLYSEILGRLVRVKVSARGIRTVEHNGGLDAFLLGTPNRKLGDEALKIKRQIAKASAAASAEASA